MLFDPFDAFAWPPDIAVLLKRAAPVVLLAVFWSLESWRPFFAWRDGRWRHAARNLSLAVVNTFVLALAFGVATVWVAESSAQRGYGLLHAWEMPYAVRFALALVLLDGWMYVWHRANHRLPWLWRFHRMHHSDPRMDVTTATRFHLGEHAGAALLRLGLIPLAGFDVWQLVVYDTLLLAVTQFHHADISLGRLDRPLRWLLVTPFMHKVHHSDWRPETDSNYSSVLSLWDRLFRSYRMRSDLRTITFGLPEFRDPAWQTWRGMWTTPLANVPAAAAPPSGEPAEEQACGPALPPRRESQTLVGT